MRSILRISLLVLSCLTAGSVHAAWTGLAAFLIDGESDWGIGGSTVEADFNRYGLRIEEKTQADLRIGASAGEFDLSFFTPGLSTEAEKYSGEFLSIYLRWPHQINDWLMLHGLFNYQFNLGDLRSDEEVEIDWTEASLQLGLAARLGDLSIRPFVDFRHVDGDISGNGSTRLLDLDEQASQGVIFDYYVEKTAYVRLRISQGGTRSFMLTLAREY